MRAVDQKITLTDTFSLKTSDGIIATSTGEFTKRCHLKGFLLLYTDLNFVLCFQNKGH